MPAFYAAGALFDMSKNITIRQHCEVSPQRNCVVFVFGAESGEKIMQLEPACSQDITVQPRMNFVVFVFDLEGEDRWD